MTYIPVPTKPEPFITLIMNVALGSVPNVQDVIEGFTKIQCKYPDASMDEVRIESIEEGSFESDLRIEVSLTFHRSTRDPAYESNSIAYQKAMKAWKKQEHEAQMRLDAKYRAEEEQRNARREYKRRSHEERKRAREQSELELANAILGIEKK